MSFWTELQKSIADSVENNRRVAKRELRDGRIQADQQSLARICSRHFTAIRSVAANAELRPAMKDAAVTGHVASLFEYVNQFAVRLPELTLHPYQAVVELERGKVVGVYALTQSGAQIQLLTGRQTVDQFLLATTDPGSYLFVDRTQVGGEEGVQFSERRVEQRKPDTLPTTDNRERFLSSLVGIRVVTKTNHGLADIVQRCIAKQVSGLPTALSQPGRIDYQTVATAGKLDRTNSKIELGIMTAVTDEVGRHTAIILELFTAKQGLVLSEEDQLWLLQKLLPNVQFMRRIPDQKNFAGFPTYSSLSADVLEACAKSNIIVLLDAPQFATLPIFDPLQFDVGRSQSAQRPIPKMDALGRPRTAVAQQSNVDARNVGSSPQRAAEERDTSAHDQELRVHLGDRCSLFFYQDSTARSQLAFGSGASSQERAQSEVMITSKRAEFISEINSLAGSISSLRHHPYTVVVEVRDGKVLGWYTAHQHYGETGHQTIQQFMEQPPLTGSYLFVDRDPSNLISPARLSESVGQALVRQRLEEPLVSTAKPDVAVARGGWPLRQRKTGKPEAPTLQERSAPRPVLTGRDGIPIDQVVADQAEAVARRILSGEQVMPLEKHRSVGQLTPASYQELQKWILSSQL